MRSLLESRPNLLLHEAEAAGLVIEDGRVTGITLADGTDVRSRAVIVTTGTFLNGLIHIGERSHPAGRVGEAPSLPMAESLRKLGLRMGRLKTGTPPRLDRRTIDYGAFEEQKGDASPTFFSLRTKECRLPQVSCYLGYTNEKLHSIIRANLKRSALYGGYITGIGPRYCPSVEDKIVKFADRERHQIFLEPEGWIRMKSTSTGFRPACRLRCRRRWSRRSLTRAGANSPARYAIEYDYVDPTELDPSLETKKLAASSSPARSTEPQATRKRRRRGWSQDKRGIEGSRRRAPSFSQAGELHRDHDRRSGDARVDEPYRMFTSRSEFRLLLRIDNADRRLRPLGYRLGLVSEKEYGALCAKYEQVERLRAFLRQHRWNPSEAFCPSLAAKLDVEEVKGATIEELLRRPGIELSDFTPLLILHPLPAPGEVWRSVEIEIRYEGYIQQQVREAERLKRMSARRIPADFDYAGIDGLNREIKEKLSRVRPLDLAMAGRIPGVTPAAVSILNLHLELLQSGRGAGNKGGDGA